MSRRKQTKPFKVEDKLEVKKDRKQKPRRILPKPEEEHGLTQADSTGANLSDAEDSFDGDVRRAAKQGRKCDECGKVLASTLSLARHKLTHSESKPYQCPQCGAGFKTSSNMHRHLRIHFRDNKEQSDSDVPLTKPRSCTQRSPRQNIRTPYKFREFDVDLVGVGPRSGNETAATYARAYSKAKVPLTPRKQSARQLKLEEDVDVEVEEDPDISADLDNDELPDLNVPRQRRPGMKQEDRACRICNKTFISKFGLLTHLVSHSDTTTDPKNKCQLCDQTFTTSKGLIVHNVIVHKIAQHKTQEASGDTVKKTERSFQDIALIDFSAKKFPQVAEVACTKSDNHPPLRDEQHIFICKKCDKAFPLLEALQIHMQKSHAKKEEPAKRTKNEISTFLASVNLQNKNENGGAEKKGKEKYAVQNGMDDDNIFTSKSVAAEDTPVWLNKQPDVIDTTYQKENDITPVRPELKFFKRVDPSSSPGSSLVASKHFNSSLLSRIPLRTVPHNRRRTRNQVDSATLLKNFEPGIRPADSDKGEKNIFWCRICNYSSREKSALVRHLLTHSGIRPYFCKICDYAFTTKANCERHVRKRHNCVERTELDAAVRCDWEMLKKAPREDIYMISGSNSSCPVCNESFSSNEDLKQHLKIHEERHFLCQLCNVRCTTRNNCVRHILHKHPGIPHQEANNIITFVGNGKNDLEMDKFEDIVQDKPIIDISKGRLGGKRPIKSNWTKSTLHHPRSLLNNPTPHKKPRMGAPPLHTSERNGLADDQDSNIPMSLPESDEGIDNSEETTRRPSKILPLIPLLKIKAYNEAASRSYADMVALYQHLNFLNSAENDVMAMDDTIMPMMDSPKMDMEDDFTRGETMFICQSCGKSFHTEEKLNNHIVICESNSNENLDQGVPMITNSEENSRDDRASNVFLNDAATNNSRMDNEPNGNKISSWDISSSGETSGVRGFDAAKASVDRWQEHSANNSPYSMKSAEDSMAQEYESHFMNGKQTPLASSYNKESSYVEDSLLMTMFADEDENDNFEEKDDTGIGNSQTGIMPSYSSSLPTMVNMDSTAITGIKLSGIKFQGPPLNAQLDDPEARVMSPNSKGKIYSARKCPQCNKVFPWASSLRRHIMTHTGLKLYMCRLCKMRFTTRSNLIRHVYRRHGMAKQHPDFASCLAKLHPSDSLLREVEADVRRRIDSRKKKKPTDEDAHDIPGKYEHDDDYVVETSGKRRKKGVTSDFQSMLEEDPETLLVDLDYSPRDELTGELEKKNLPVSKLIEGETASSTTVISAEEDVKEDEQEEEDDDEMNVDGKAMDNTPNDSVKEPELEDEEELEVDMTNSLEKQSTADELSPSKTVTPEVVPSSPKNLRSRSEHKNANAKSPTQGKNPTQSPKPQKEIKQETTEEPESKGGKARSKQSSQFMCGLCKKIFETVPDLITHLDGHNVPHSWRCAICGVPFTNKYNCQRHLTRRHGRSDVEPLYVEDVKHGPRNARGGKSHK